MPPARIIRPRAVTNENDEIAATTRLTRAKAVGLTSEGQTNTAAIKKPLQSKKSVLGAANAGVQRRRAALGDVSNVTKGDGVEVNELKEVKKTATARVGLTSKAVPHAGGVQKITRTNTTRAALGVRDTNKREPELKRPGSGSGVMGPSQLKRQPSPKSLVTDENYSGTEEPPRKRIDSGKKATAFKEYSEVEVKSEAEVKREVEVQREIEVKTEVQVKREVEVKEEIYSDVQDGEQVINLDEDDELDPLMVPDYAVEIFDYLLEIEPQTMPNPNYIEHQDELEWKMRGILVDWLIEVHTRFRMLPETLFLSVNIIDRFLSNDVVALDRLQLVGVAAMFIAAKYEEILSPHVATFSHVADETFTDKEILDAERHILATLDYDISYPNPMNFLRRISKADNYDVQARTYGKYLMEISLLDHRFMCYRQSLIAAAAMYFARLILDHGPWDATLAHYSGYTKEEILPVFHLMVDYLYRPVVHEAFFRKYASKRFLKASIHARHWAKRYRSLYLKKRSEMSEQQKYVQSAHES